jgi:hypothetical protein
MQRLQGVESEKVLDNGPLEYLFAGSAIAKILDFLSTHQEWDYSESDIAKYAGVNVRTVQREIPKLANTRLVKHTRTVGRAKMYKLDVTSKAGQFVDRLAHQIAKARIRAKVTS